MDHEERRSAKRYRFKFPLQVSWPGGESPAESVEVSSRAVYFFFRESVPVGTPLRFVLTLFPEMTESNPVHLKCEGRVLRTDFVAEGRIGIAASIRQYEFARM